MVFNFDTTYKNLPDKFYSYIRPQKFSNYNIEIINQDVVKLLGINEDELKADILIDDNLLEEPIAQAYCGHQFGHFNMLGDGRALLLGEHVYQNKRFDIQLKGSGKTPYSRGGDGKAVLSSVLREYIYSQAIDSLNINTSKSLAVLKTGEQINRNKKEDGAILIRVMSSHIRFGTFEYVSAFIPEHLEDFVNYVINRHYPDLYAQEDKYINFFRKVMNNSIDMVINWMRVGFIHGVMNTDNMSICGETFDYGPCSFMNYYDEDTTFSMVDSNRRYCFKNQKIMLGWNLARFAESLLPLFKSEQKKYAEVLQSILNEFDGIYEEKFYVMMSHKLGIGGVNRELVDEVIEWLKKSRADYTNTFIELAYPNSFEDEVYKKKDFKLLREKISKVGLDKSLMNKVNPVFIPRNYLVEEAIESYNISSDKFYELIEVIKNPYEFRDEFRKYQLPPKQDYDLKYQTHCNT